LVISIDDCIQLRLWPKFLFDHLQDREYLASAAVTMPRKRLPLLHRLATPSVEHTQRARSKLKDKLQAKRAADRPAIATLNKAAKHGSAAQLRMRSCFVQLPRSPLNKAAYKIYSSSSQTQTHSPSCSPTTPRAVDRGAAVTGMVTKVVDDGPHTPASSAKKQSMLSLLLPDPLTLLYCTAHPEPAVRARRRARLESLREHARHSMRDTFFPFSPTRQLTRPQA
jgi:hypothetical protein